MKHKKVLKRFIVVVSLLFALVLSGCDVVMQLTQENDEYGNTTYTIDITAQDAGLVLAMYGDKAARIEGWMETTALRNGYSFAKTETGYRMQQTVYYIPSEESVDPVGENFFFAKYEYQDSSPFFGLVGNVQYTEGEAYYLLSPVRDILWGSDLPRISDEGEVYINSTEGFWYFIQDDPALVASVRESIEKLKIFYTMRNMYTGFYSDADYISRVNGVAVHTWDLTNNTERYIVFGQLYPKGTNWYIALLIGTGLFIAGGIGIYMLVNWKSKKPVEGAV